MISICGDFGRGGHVVLPVERARVWKWVVCWVGSSLWYGPTPERFFKTRQAAQSFWSKQTQHFTKRQHRDWINGLLEQEEALKS
jgi:hypothetical protein